MDTNLDASSTLITFHTPIPLVRGPLPCRDPSSGPYVLAFRDPQAWASSYLSCHCNILTQCHEASRMGCAITASNKCKPPWWKLLLGSPSKELKEREQCEEREMSECFDSAKDKCLQFATTKCLVPFRDARIKGLGFRDALRLASMNHRTSFMMTIFTPIHVTNCRATELLDYDDFVQCILGERKQQIK